MPRVQKIEVENGAAEMMVEQSRKEISEPWTWAKSITHPYISKFSHGYTVQSTAFVDQGSDVKLVHPSVFEDLQKHDMLMASKVLD